MTRCDATAPRPRNAAGTRNAILISARQRFARQNYETVGLREIAGDVGVDPSLVCRYFGGKEHLFKEALHDDEFHLMAGATRESLAQYFADLILSDTDTEAAAARTDRLLMLVRSVSSRQASEIVHDALEADILSPVASLLSGKDTEIRASLCLAALMGASILLYALPTTALQDADRAALAQRLTGMFALALAE